MKTTSIFNNASGRINQLGKLGRAIAGAALALALVVSFVPQAAFAITPTFNVSTFSGDSVQINVYGDANHTVNLFYYPQGSSSVVSRGVIGTTNSNGSFSTTVNASSYNVPSGSLAYVIVNGQQSASVSWPYYTGGGNNNYAISFSQNNLVLNSGQSITVQIYGGSGGYYVASNSNTGLVSTTLSGSQLILSTNGNSQNGSASIQVCSSGYNSGCGTLYVTVQYYGTGQQISLSQTNVSLQQGQGQQIQIYGSGSYSISSNSNPNAVSAYITGSTLNLYGSNSGSSNLNICSSQSGGCVNLYVTVSGGYYGGTYYNNNDYYNCYYYGYGNCGQYTYNNTNQYYNPYTYYYDTTYSSSGNGYTDASGRPYFDLPTGGTPVAGVYLNQIPSTGIDSFKTAGYVLGLMVWSVGITALIANRKKLLSI